ncbi:ParB/RepB/Spo0J family partition protein [Methylibium rhizosphaerae]|uniref:ParB/RepB/Spo0J family partition protein n=1 Tax=Methylibium rhizosphaerae TaxID=2570323 RepID=UPI001FED1A6D|nr:ParB/RepB/Spo0J family partition protein [Methylibium rhizosphaerae]
MSLLLDDLDLGDGGRLAGATMPPQGEVGPLELVAPEGVPSGDGAVPMQIPIELVDEDPSQPRQEFSAQALQELAETIRERGVRQPVSVRRHPEHAGRWMLNFGARRLRASRLAQREAIPAFVDEAADSYDQVIENEQREGLTALELALFVQRRMAMGESQAEIARRMGKSKTLITMATALIDAPDWLMQAYREGRCRGLTKLYELRRLHEQQPEAVAEAIAAKVPITRQDLSELRARAAATGVAGRPGQAVRDREAEPQRAARTRSKLSPMNCGEAGGPRVAEQAREAELHCRALEGILSGWSELGSDEALRAMRAVRARLAALAAGAGGGEGV